MGDVLMKKYWKENWILCNNFAKILFCCIDFLVSIFFSNKVIVKRVLTLSVKKDLTIVQNVLLSATSLQLC